MDTSAVAASSATSPLAPIMIPRREVGPNDVRIEILFCGICHSDLHTVRGDWAGTVYPCVPGHEIIGRAVEVGEEVTRHQVGDLVGVGVNVDSCGECTACLAGLQSHCRRIATGTYNAPDPHGTAPVTYGGYSASIVVTELFVYAIPDGLDPAAAAPLLCAGTTMYGPLRLHGVGKGTRVGIAGFGGLGSTGVKLAKALGAHVTVITRSDRKASDAQKAGADEVLVSGDTAAMRSATGSLDLILSTIPLDHDLVPYLGLLGFDGTYVVLGAIAPLTHPIPAGLLIFNRLKVTGSATGGVPQVQELLELCAGRGIVSDVQVVGVDEVNDAYDRLASGDPDHRFVLDLSTLRSPG